MSMIGITSCGTDIGKTFISCALIRELRRRGRTVHALKPAISGMAGVPLSETDSGRLLDAMGVDVTQAHVDKISPWQFQAPLTPSMAARAENRSLNMDKMVQWCHQQNEAGTLTLVEGAGGVMAPLTDNHTMRDFFAELGAPLLLVVGCYLGSISHALTALHALQGQHVLAVVVSDKNADSGVGLEATASELARFVPSDIAIVPVPKGAPATAISALSDILEAYVSR